MEFYDFAQAKEFLGISTSTLRRLIRNGLVECMNSGHKLLFAVEELERFRQLEYPGGMTHTEIAAKYGVKRGSVIYHFSRLHVKPTGFNRGLHYGAVYDPETVAKFAQLLGWVETPPRNQTDES